MRSGIVHDLAVGVHPEGSDAWALRDVLAQGVSVGAPPDMYNQMGQNWSQPPWRPDALAEAGFLPYRDMLRTILRHAGGIRVDHVLGLFRLWWIPEGMPAYSGTYVTSDHEALIGILALESQRAGAWLVGEDLGTVEQWVQDYLLSARRPGHHDHVVRARLRRRIPTSRCSRSSGAGNCLASVTVHDLPPTAGYLAGEHVRIRAELGLLTRPAEEELAESNAQVAEWRAMCVDRGWMPRRRDRRRTWSSPCTARGRVAVRAAGVALTDAVGDRRAQNQPGTDKEYPNWRVPLTDARGQAVLIEDFPNLPLLRRLVEAVRAGRSRPGRSGVAGLAAQ